jgi:hypothetical protein
MKRMYISLFAVIISVVFASSVFADSDHNFEGATKIINTKTPCTELSESQLEQIGDYYMEQMHPGDAHGVMDEMMGGEGSESLKQAHVMMARRWYCGDNAGIGMMGMMMGSGMMGGALSTDAESGVATQKVTKSLNKFTHASNGFGMMGSFELGGFWITKILIWILLIVGIAAFVKYLVNKK